MKGKRKNIWRNGGYSCWWKFRYLSFQIARSPHCLPVGHNRCGHTPPFVLVMYVHLSLDLETRLRLWHCKIRDLLRSLQAPESIRTPLQCGRRYAKELSEPRVSHARSLDQKRITRTAVAHSSKYNPSHIPSPPHILGPSPFCSLDAVSLALTSNTSGCSCTLGSNPIPTALRIAFAILRWFTARRPVSRRCLIRPMEVMYSDIIEKFLYSANGLIPNTSKTSLSLLFLFRHLTASTLLRSCGAYTSPARHLDMRGACRSRSFFRVTCWGSSWRAERLLS